MANIMERVSYLRGLCDGMNLQPDTNEAKLLLAIVDVLGEMGGQFQAMQADLDELDEYVDAIDEDISNIEETLYGEEREGFSSYPAQGEDVIEFECPHCNNRILFDAYEFDLESEHICPNCGKSISLDEDDDE